MNIESFSCSKVRKVCVSALLCVLCTYYFSVRLLSFGSRQTLQTTGCRHCRLVGSSGVEPPTSCLSGMRSNLLSYEPLCLAQLILTFGLCFNSLWTTFSVLQPMVEMKGIEPLTPCLQGRCSPSWATPPYGIVNSEKWRVLVEKSSTFLPIIHFSSFIIHFYSQPSLKIEQQL